MPEQGLIIGNEKINERKIFDFEKSWKATYGRAKLW